ncbi:hypothetical protein [Massilia sp. NP310]|uniref:hypothetical protein n=1 Tax=Massilia sp. NP310 TaxID=2861282 RepID=UPI001C635BCA|nr:hypothetical protein [Massilia sp. NP310]QYG03880.1 hypothetical protein KY496_11120 [Massilia sp. NP310]
MKDTTLQTLITARALFEQAQKLCLEGDRYLATAGLIVLQDAFELILYATLVELGVDELKKLESLDFDGMVTEVGKQGIKVPKSGTLRAMNKLRVTAKHYGQVMEPRTVQDHLNTVRLVSDVILKECTGKALNEIFLTELISRSPARDHLDQAAILLSANNFHGALIETRKAYYLEFIEPYNIYGYRDKALDLDRADGFMLLAIGGIKAPAHTRNPEWIATHVNTPFDYIQIDRETWRVDAIEWGITTRTLLAIEVLTPVVIRLHRNGDWLHREYEVFLRVDPTRENATSALDLTVEVIRRKQEHQKLNRIPDAKYAARLSNAYIGMPVYCKADKSSEITYTIAEHDMTNVFETVDGFKDGERYHFVFCHDSDNRMNHGFIPVIPGESLKFMDQTQHHP